MSQDLSTLSAPQLKNIAKGRNIAYPAMASAKQMIEILNKAGVMEAVDADFSSKEAKSAKAKAKKEEEKEEAVEFEFRGEEGYEVCTNLKYNGGRYSKGDVVVIEEEEIARQLFSDGVIK